MSNFKVGDNVYIKGQITNIEQNKIQVVLEGGYSINFRERHLIYKSYDDGLTDGWNLASKLIKQDEYSEKTLREIFNMSSCAIFETLTVQEVFKKLEEYERKKIKIGDVVEYHDNEIWVTEVDEYTNTFGGIKISAGDNFGGVYSVRDIAKCRPTGKHLELGTVFALINKRNE